MARRNQPNTTPIQRRPRRSGGLAPLLRLHVHEETSQYARNAAISAACVTRYANRKFAGCVLVSDNESWINAGRPFGYGSRQATGVLAQWESFVRSQVRLYGRGLAGPKLACIDLQPYTTTQAPERSDILNVGGFSDVVFSVVAAFLADDSGCFVSEVEAVEL